MRFAQVAKKITAEGDRFLAKNNIKDFHKIASELLLKSKLHELYQFDDIVEETFTSRLPQNFKNLEFSDLPITVSRGERCFIDIYFWRRRPTVVHNHHFAGAFMCLTGNNVDLEYKFKKSKRLGKYHDLGELILKQKRQMIPGDIAEIGFMDKFIHQNHHQAELTVNLCFRTYQEPDKSLSNYLYSGIRFEKNVDLLGRVARLERLCHLGKFDEEKLKLSTDDAVMFLIQTFGTQTQNPRLLKLRRHLDKRIKDETGLNIDDFMKRHEKKLDELENDYE
jgi:hypothetical protein